MIVITGAAGFIGSCLVSRLNEENYFDLILVDDFSDDQKNKNLQGKKWSEKIDRNRFISWLKENHHLTQFIFHLGARTDTTERDRELLKRLNLDYSINIWKHCVEFGIPLVYASSAATYGMGELGYDDDEEIIPDLKPLNAYGDSKNEFDIWALKQERKPYFWAGLKFFNVYGPNEYHKGRMASVVFHTFRQIKDTGRMELFESHKTGIKNGEQMRDFVYVKDVLDVMYFLMHNRKQSGIFNLGSGQARTFLDLASETFKAIGEPVNISFIPTPVDIRDKYQYFTEAKMSKLRDAGYSKPFTTLEEGVHDYVSRYLIEGRYM